MATFLDLCKDLRRESGLSGTGPASVVGQSGMDGKVVEWINDSWYELQSSRNDWRWMWRNNGLVTTTIGQRTYDLPLLGFDFEHLIKESLSIQVTGNANTIIELTLLSWAEFRDLTAFRPVTSGQPSYCAIAPDDSLYLETSPDQQYDIAFEWYEKASYMANNGDAPAMPLPYHRILVEMGLMKYAVHDGAIEVHQVAEKEYRKWLRRLERSQLPDIVGPDSLA